MTDTNKFRKRQPEEVALVSVLRFTSINSENSRQGGRPNYMKQFMHLQDSVFTELNSTECQ